MGVGKFIRPGNVWRGMDCQLQKPLSMANADLPRPTCNQEAEESYGGEKIR